MTACQIRRVAAALPEAVRNGDEAGFARLMERVSAGRELAELVRVLAASADPGRLARACGCEVPARLREAHAEYERLRSARQPRPADVRAGERAYQTARKRVQRSAAAEEEAA